MTQRPTLQMLIDVAGDLVRAPHQAAYTMPAIPHFYTPGKRWIEEGYLSWRRYTEIADTILSLNDLEEFRGKDYHMFFANGYKWWPVRTNAPRGMKSQSDGYNLINRLRAHYGSFWDYYARDYDALHVGEEFESALTLVRDILGDARDKSVLELNAATGALLAGLGDNAPCPNLYTGVEPSSHLRRRFVGKHPSYSRRLVGAPMRDLYPLRSYDFVVGLWDAGYEFTFTDMDKVQGSVKPDGWWLVMVANDRAYGSDGLTGNPFYQSEGNLAGNMAIEEVAEERLLRGPFTLYMGGANARTLHRQPVLFG